MSGGYRWDNVWVTGASSGIGYEFSKLLVPKARSIAVSARSSGKLDALAQGRPSIKSFPLDVTDSRAVIEVIEAVEESGGPIDLAVLNAGIWQWMNVDQFELPAVRDCFEVNYMGVVNALDGLLPRMIARGQGHIAIVASVAGYRGLPGAAAYGPTKAALINLAETLRTELAPRGITVSLVNPGFIDTPMTEVNDFPMPYIMPAQDAAKRLLAGLVREDYEIVFPRRFVWQLKLLRLLPNALYFWVVRTFIGK